MSAYQQTNFGFTGSLVVIIGPMVATTILFALLPLIFSVVRPPTEPKAKTYEIPLPQKINKVPAEFERTREETRPINTQRQQQTKKTTETPTMEPLIEGLEENPLETMPIVTNNLVKDPKVEFTVPRSFEPPVFTIDEVDQPPRILRKVMPQYPSHAERNNIEGKVVLRFIVDSRGNIVEPEVTESEPEGVFDDAAMEAIRKYKFKPAEKAGEPVDCIVIVPMSFRLR